MGDPHGAPGGINVVGEGVKNGLVADIGIKEPAVVAGATLVLSGVLPYTCVLALLEL